MESSEVLAQRLTDDYGRDGVGDTDDMNASADEDGYGVENGDYGYIVTVTFRISICLFPSSDSTLACVSDY